MSDVAGLLGRLLAVLSEIKEEIAYGFADVAEALELMNDVFGSDEDEDAA